MVNLTPTKTDDTDTCPVSTAKVISSSPDLNEKQFSLIPRAVSLNRLPLQAVLLNAKSPTKLTGREKHQCSQQPK